MNRNSPIMFKISCKRKNKVIYQFRGYFEPLFSNKIPIVEESHKSSK